MKHNLTIVFTILVIILGLFILYNFNDERNTYNNLSNENIKLDTCYFNLQNTIAQYKENIEKDDIMEDDFLNTMTTSEKEIEIVTSDIERIINDMIDEDLENKKAYLTFDDGPSRITSKILDVLKEYGVKGTFFVNGKEDEYSKSIYRRIVDEGHSIGNHTYIHSYKRIYNSIKDFNNDYNKLQKLIKETTGVTINIMRFPGGSNNTISNRYSKGIMTKLTQYYKMLGFQYFDWNVSGGDSRSRGASVRSITNNVLRGSRRKNNIIILLHDSRYKRNTLAALPKIIKSLQNDGFTLLPLNNNSPNVQFR